MKNSILSASKNSTKQVRKKIVSNRVIPNNESRERFQSQAVSGEERLIRYKWLMKQLSHVNAGRKFTREEANQH